ncbi:MAG: Rpn family recombination-promoting nuclease/putative transposase [Eubacteriales bacterium]|nr:Rpn family recombination-promoting nuclease/putative transposase [Eubacteriales bacterium]
MAKENREHKDSVFADLFGKDETAKENLLELYNALYDEKDTDPEVIKWIGLEDVLFKNFRNDVAFTVRNRKIILSEHQSTVNPNMPLRDLFYVAREYEKIISVRVRYRKKLVKIPTPEFIVFYNGTENYPTEQVLKLSDAFFDQPEKVSLELNVRVININPEKHHEVLKKCKILQEYSLFVEATRKYREDEKQLEKTVKECINKGILADYLLRKSSEVINMLMAEYDYEMDIEVQREEAAQEAADRKFIEYVDKAVKNFHISAEEACEKLEESYERYLELKKLYSGK